MPWLIRIQNGHCMIVYLILSTEAVRIVHGCSVCLEESIPRDQYLASRGKKVIPRNGFFCMPRTPMTDSFSCLPFNFQCLFIFQLILNAALPTIHNEVDVHHLES